MIHILCKNGHAIWAEEQTWDKNDELASQTVELALLMFKNGLIPRSYTFLDRRMNKLVAAIRDDIDGPRRVDKHILEDEVQGAANFYIF